VPDAPEASKRCTLCGQTLPLESFAFKDKRRGKRLSRRRACCARISRAHYLRNPAAYKARARQNTERSVSR
jgi:hypothetical protein